MREFPGIQVSVSRMDGREVWRIKGAADQEAKAFQMLKAMLSQQDELGNRKDPFQLDDLDWNDLERRWCERAAMLEIDDAIELDETP